MDAARSPTMCVHGHRSSTHSAGSTGHAFNNTINDDDDKDDDVDFFLPETKNDKRTKGKTKSKSSCLLLEFFYFVAMLVTRVLQ